MYYVITSAVTMIKSHENKMSNLFFYDGVVKCRRNLNFEKIDTASYTGKMMDLITVRNI